MIFYEILYETKLLVYFFYNLQKKTTIRFKKLLFPHFDAGPIKKNKPRIRSLPLKESNHLGNTIILQKENPCTRFVVVGYRWNLFSYGTNLLEEC